MRPMTRILFLFAALGFILSAISHAASFFNSTGPLGTAAPILHIGIFVVWIPTIFVTRKLTKDVPSRDWWKAALRGCPTWMKYGTFSAFGYALLNFAIFLALAPAEPTSQGMSPIDVRGFSGHWMAFYAVACSVLYSSSRLENAATNRKCPNGHPVSPFANYCDTCGISLHSL